jgi:hypothetical protein
MNRAKLPCILATGLALIAHDRSIRADDGEKADLQRKVLKVRSTIADLRKYKQAMEFTMGAAKDLEEGKEPRKPKAFKFGKIEGRLNEMLHAVEDLKVPGPINSDDPKYSVDANEFRGDAASKERAAAKMIALYRALRKQVEQMETSKTALEETVEAADLSEKSGRKLRDAFEDLHNAPAVRALFGDTFGFAWLDFSEVLLPKVASIRNEADDRAKEFARSLADRRRRLKTFGANLRDILRGIGTAIPNDIHQ